MTDKEVNEIIAEFDGKRVSTSRPGMLEDHSGWDAGYVYTKSLDSLVPVWEKLNYDPEFIQTVPDKKWQCTLLSIRLCGSNDGDIVGISMKDTIQQAAAHATAKAIKEL